MPYLTATKEGNVRITVHVQPKSSRNAVSGLYDGCLKIAVTTPPVDGKANKAVAAFLAKLFCVAKRDITLVSGQASRRKIFTIADVTIEEIRGHIEPILEH